MKKIILMLITLACFTGLMYAQGEVINAETYASYYGEAFHGRQTANGEIFDMNAYTAAHKTLPFGTMVEVTNLENGKKVVVRINDRGPFVGNREIDISKAAAAALDMLSRGVTRVSLRKIDTNDKAAFGVSGTSGGMQSASQSQTSQYQQAQNSQYGSQGAVQGQQYPGQPPQYGAQQTQGQQYNSQQYQGSQETAQYQPPRMQDPQYGSQSQYGSQYGQTQSQYGSQYQPVQTMTQYQQPQRELVYIPTTPAETSGELWRIQLGSFAREENAMRLIVQLRKIGFEPAYEKTETHIRVVLYGIRPYDLEKVKDVLKTHNFKDYVLKQENW
ncbi:RlpA family lipoprotein [Treponema pedis str. T A4]|uniref:Probable endolytic peptidoglycan transglycosylase RlpA n=2 Tax=Treponema pedis TaxID=409322 RepID=S5ZQS7_9SPIR|nr:septal ring lytic transglycosylase RlpA family protein [Treponema pedis]AGT45012.1 RlpA family lipoprotein [Treponema pedis str. T A4]